MCFFWVPLFLLPILGIKSLQTPILGSLICFFKLIVQNIETCILSNYRIESNQILHNTKDNQVLIVGGHIWGRCPGQISYLNRQHVTTVNGPNIAKFS